MQAVLRRPLAALVLIIGLSVSVGPSGAFGQAPPGADLAVTKTASPDPVLPGSNLTYTITVANLGPAAASSVSLSDFIPFNTTFVSATQNTGPAFALTTPPAGGSGVFAATATTFASGASGTFTLVVNVNALGVPFFSNQVFNQALASSFTFDPISENNWMFAVTTITTPAADLAVTKSDSPDPVDPGASLTYTLTVSNNGPNAALGVSLFDLLPSGTEFASFTQTAGPAFTLVASPAASLVSGTAATLANGASATFSLVVRVTTQSGLVVNFASVSGSTTDPNPFNNSSFITTSVAQPPADLAVAKSVSADPVAPGDNLTYLITLKNNGPNAAQFPSLSDSVPANTTFVSAVQESGPAFNLFAFGSGFFASTPTFASGASATFRLVVKVNPGTVDGTLITNSASVVTFSGSSDPNFANNFASATTTVTTQADVAVTKAGGPNPVAAGGNLTYVIEVANKSPIPAQQVVMSDSVPAGTTFVSVTQTSGPASVCGTLPNPASAGVSSAQSRTVTCLIAALPGGSAAQFSVVVKLNANAPNGTVIANEATVSSYSADPDSSNNSATVLTTVRNVSGGAGIGAILSRIHQDRRPPEASVEPFARPVIVPPSTGDAGLRKDYSDRGTLP